jgi:hypothetical protein
MSFFFVKCSDKGDQNICSLLLPTPGSYSVHESANILRRKVGIKNGSQFTIITAL